MSIDPTSPSVVRRVSRTSGVTLMELLMAIGVMSLVGVAVVLLAVATGRSFAEMVSYVDFDHYNRIALDMLSRDIRQVQYLQSFSSNSMTFVDKDGQPLQYRYSPTDQSLVRIKGGQTKVLLDHCDRMQFGIYQRSPISNQFDLYPATAVTNTKVVRVTWNCSRRLVGRRLISQQAQAARIVIRNKKEL